VTKRFFDGHAVNLSCRSFEDRSSRSVLLPAASRNGIVKRRGSLKIFEPTFDQETENVP
jgi:hypothetical protein